MCKSQSCSPSFPNQGTVGSFYIYSNPSMLLRTTRHSIFPRPTSLPTPQMPSASQSTGPLWARHLTK